jgi:chromosome segregation ATPase
MQLENATEEQGKLLKDAIANLSTGLGELKLNLSRAQREWAENLTALMKEQAALERELASQGRELDEKLLGTSQEVNKISRRMDNMSSEVEGLRLRISDLERALEAKDLEITLLYRWSMILLLLLAASMVIAVVALIRGRGKVRKEGGESAPIWGYA